MAKVDLLTKSLISIKYLTGKRRRTNHYYLKQGRKNDAVKREQAPVWESSELVKWHLYVKQELNKLRTLSAVGDEVPSGAPQELNLITQVVLNTLNSAPNRFHDLSELPGLETHAPQQLDQFSNYLSQQGWIEEKVMVTGLLVKLTMKGQLFAEQHNAWV